MFHSIFPPQIFLPQFRFLGSHHGPQAAHGDHEPKAEDPKMRGGQRGALESLSAPHLWVLIRRFMGSHHDLQAAHWDHEPVPATSSRRVVGGLLEAPSNYSCPRTAAGSRRHRFMERGQVSQRSQCCGVPVDRRRNAFPPLPLGEGRGEGERLRPQPNRAGN